MCEKGLGVALHGNYSAYQCNETADHWEKETGFASSI